MVFGTTGGSHGPANWHFSLLTRPADHAPPHRLFTGHWTDYRTHTGAGGQCTDAIEEGIVADEPACVHMGTGSGSLRGAKGKNGDAYVMPCWVG